MSEQIVGGQEVDITEAPWQIGIVSNDRKHHYCGGTIIGDTWVLTSKRCLNPYGATQWFVHAGSTHKLEGGQFVGVARTIPHPSCRFFEP